MIEVLLAALLAAAAVVFVAVPFLRDDEPAPVPEPEPDRLADAEERDRALAELKELEFDHRTGKITDEDYRTLVQPLRRRAAQTLQNGSPLSRVASEDASEQPFSAGSLPSSRSER
jgi:cytochrome c-type biogenesis protein CcmI